MQLCRIVDSKYIREVFSVKYGIKNYDDKARYKFINKCCRKIQRDLIINLKAYNIQYFSLRLIVFSLTLNKPPSKLLNFVSFDLIFKCNFDKYYLVYKVISNIIYAYLTSMLSKYSIILYILISVTHWCYSYFIYI